ncbi:MAG: DUF4175 family protein [Isosphaerales bacterium]
MNGMTPDLEVPALSAEIPGVLGKLEATRRELKVFHIWLGLASLVLWELTLAAALILADWLWVLPSVVRGLGLLAMVAVAVILHLRAHRRYSRDQAAADAEAHFPELGQRLRTVVDYAEPGGESVPASPGLLRALGRDTDHRTAGLDFRKLIPWTTFGRRAVVLFFAASFGIVALFLSPGLRTAALRMLLLPVHYTTLDVKPGDLTLKAGDELKLNVTLSGRPVSSAHWFYREKKSGRGWISASLAPTRSPLAAPSQGRERDRPLVGLLTSSLKDCQTDLDYRVVAGELESPVFHVKVVHPLFLKGVEAAITPPAYTRRPPEVVKGGNFKVIEGSRVELTIKLDHAPKSAALVLGSTGGEPSPEMVPLNIDGVKLTGLLPPITKEMSYQIDAVDEDGMKLEADSFRIKVALDEKPTIQFIQPDESLGVTPVTEVPIQVEAGDDFGVSRLGITYKVGDGPEETLHLADYKDLPVTAEALATLYLEKHQIDYRDGISYYAFVLDNYPPEPHRVVSELRFIDILPYKQVYKLVEGEGSSSSSLSLEELIARQRVNLNRTFVLERDRSIDAAAAMRLATFEEELATATAEFSEGLKANGRQVTALDDAVSAMRSAILSLDAKQLPSARSHEETALKSLISARQNLRQLLNQSSSRQASECRKFDRQQVQKIRRPPPDKSKEELARLEEDLDELAEREQDFSEEIEARGGGGPELEPPPRNEAQAKSSQKPSSESPKKGPGPASGKSASQAPRPRPNPVQEQQQAAEEAERLRRLAQKDKALTDLANRRLEAAAKLVQESSRAIEAGQSAEAAEKARDAARKLEAAARQVGALKAPELADGLARVRDIAQAIAKSERELGKSLEPGPESKEAGTGARTVLAGRQRELADDVAALADVLERLRSGAALEHRELAQTIDRAARRNPPGEVEDSMRRNAEAIGSGRTAQAARDADDAALRLDALAQDLEIARRAAVQPELERLLAAEKQAALLLERLRSAQQPSHRAEAQKGMAELAEVVDKLAPGEGPLRQAVDKLRSAIQSSHTGVLPRVDESEQGPGGFRLPSVGSNDGVATVILALQAKIQEIILDNALADRDGPVPPRYKELVEDYYRVLSQDLR